MNRFSSRVRWALAMGALAVGPFIASACKDYSKDLLLPENPGIVSGDAVGSPAAAAALRVGAIGRVKNLVNCGGECLWMEGGMLADEYKNSDFQNTRQDIDQRQITSDNTILSYSTVTQSRGYVRTALLAMQTYAPTSTADIAELYLSLGFVEMSLAETYCNGIPLGSALNGNVVLGPPLTTAQVYDSASAHLDTALLVVTGTDAGSLFIKNAALLIKARILMNQAQYAAAAALVGGVPSAYQYVWTSDPGSNGDDNGVWQLNLSTARITVADSFDIVNGANNIVKNNLPFASANDTRVPVKSGNAVTPKVPPEDGSTPQFVQLIWGRDDPLPVASGIDARMIEAEAKLNAADYAGMMTILNALRAAPPKIGVYQPTVLAPLATTPTTKDAALNLFFREKGFWTFGRGQRLGDLRRLIRQYGRTQDNVFPSGVYFKGGQYGSDVNFPVPDGEKVNPAFQGCIDRKA
jgi:hypothetical protein